MRLILFGAPGSGKGTQGDLVAKRYGFPRISTGDLLRAAVEKKTALGRKAEAVMKEGRLVNDEIVVDLVSERISDADCRRGYILDGFPRTIAQAEALAALDGQRPEIVIGIEVPAEVLIRRLSGRRICSSCQAVFNLAVQPPRQEGRCDFCHGPLVQRPDDTPEVIRERLRVYHDQTETLKDLYIRRGTYREIDGQGSIEEIFERIVAVLDGLIIGGERRQVRT
jgi:adenylate kinase